MCGRLCCIRAALTSIPLPGPFQELCPCFMVPWPLHSWDSNWGCTLTSGLSWPLAVPSLSGSPWSLHAFKNSTTWETPTQCQVWMPAQGTALPPSGPQLLGAESGETLHRRSGPNDANSSVLTVPAKQRCHFSHSGLLLVTAGSSAPADWS